MQLDQVAEYPPSTKSVCPVTAALPEPARNTAQAAKSRGTPLRPVIVRAAWAATFDASANTSSVSGVCTTPGAIALQHTPLRDQASACERVNATRPALDTPYAPLLPYARNACRSRNGAVRFAARVTSQSSAVSRSSGGRRFTAAALTSTSGSPYASRT